VGSWVRILIFTLLLFPCGQVLAEAGITLVTSSPTADGGQTYTLTIKILMLMTVLTFLPALLLMMTSFARIAIVLSIMRQAMGTPQTPSNQIIIGLSLFLTFFIMAPVFDRTYNESLKPYLDDKISDQEALEKAEAPFRDFMMAQTRESDLSLFANIAGLEEIESPDDVPFTVLVPAFITSELKTAFQIGFLIFVPFVVIDLVVASVLMSMGMMMLSPMLIALPFKLMLFVLVDGWSLIISSLAASFAV
jgi:flagellar biosynthetic protein FliP